jgi:aminocarboxymuconate-semialdehyde decarboxylase
MVHARSVRPEMADCPDDLTAALGQLYFDTITHDPGALRFLVTQMGVTNVVLGTDMPYDMAMQQPIETLCAVFDDATVAAITSGNPRQLFGWPAPGEF